MKTYLGPLAGMLLFLCVALPQCATLTPSKVVRSVLNYADALCILAHAEFDEPAILQACQIERDFAPVVRDLVASQRAAAARSGACSKRPTAQDGGHEP